MVRLLGLSLFFLVVVGLAACSATPKIYARYGETGLEILLRESEFAPTSLEVRAEWDSSREVDLWASRGPAWQLRATLRYGTPPLDWTTAFGPRELPMDAERVVAIVRAGGSTRVGSFDYQQLRSDDWATSDGHYFSGTCASAPD